MNGKQQTARVEFPNLQETQTARSDPAGYSFGNLKKNMTTVWADLQSAIFMYPDQKRNRKRESKHNPESLPKMEHRRNISNSI